MKKIFTLIAVAMLALAAQAESLTVCGGEYYSANTPIYGLWYDTPGMTQQIYSADMLAEMAGGQITELTFYTLAAFDDPSYDFSEYVINFSGGEVTLSLMEVEQASFTEATPLEGAQVVATVVPEAGGMELKFVFDEPYDYQGGNLLVQVDVTEAGQYGTTYFWGTGSDEDDAPTPTYYENYNYQGEISGNGISTFLSRVTFAYTLGGENKFYVVGFNDWENPIEITEEDGATVDVSAQNFDDPEDTAQEFKIICPAEDGGWNWYGGVDENAAGFFLVGEDLLNHIITLDDEGVNFRLAEPGNYTIRLVFLDKAAASGMYLYVTKNEVTAVNGISAKAVAGVKYYNLAGVESNKPFNGINIAVTTYTDGTSSTTKVIK